MFESTASGSADSSRAYGTWLSALFFLLILCYWVFARYVERIDMSGQLPNQWLSLVVAFPLFDTLSPILIWVREFFALKVLRHFIPIVAGIYLANQATLFIIQRLYHLPDQNEASRLFQRLKMGGRGKPTVVHRATLEENRARFSLLSVGGPGKIRIQSGEVGVTEQNGRTKRILPAGTHRLYHFERIMTIIDLREQERNVGQVALLTKDGIELTTTLGLAYRIKRGDASPTKAKPFPFDEHAVRKAAYAGISSTDGLLKWDDLPPTIAIGQLEDTILQFNLDDLLDLQGQYLPNQNHAPLRDNHQIIREKLHQKIDDQLQDYGVEIVSIRLGSFAFNSDVTQQSIDYWRAIKDQIRMRKRSQGEAAALETLSLAKANAKLNLIHSLVQNIENAQLQSGEEINKQIIALQLIDAIESMALQTAGQIDPELMRQLALWRGPIQSDPPTENDA